MSSEIRRPPFASTGNADQIPLDGYPIKKGPTKPAAPTGRELAKQVCNLRAYLAMTLKAQGLRLNLDPDHWSSSSVTSAAITLEHQGVRGIPDDVFETF